MSISLQLLFSLGHSVHRCKFTKAVLGVGWQGVSSQAAARLKWETETCR